MNKVEQILLDWEKSIPEDYEISKSYSIIGNRVFLTITRQLENCDTGKTLKIECENDANSVLRAIEKLSTNRELLLEG